MANTPAEQLPRRVAVVGLGYFSQFHLDAWQREAGAQLVAVCDRDAALATEVGEARGVPAYTALQALLADHSVDVVDIVAPPSAHATLVRAALAPGRTVICQKPFSDSVATAERLLAESEAAGCALVVHENFRFQPWHREIYDILRSGTLGEVYQVRFALRPGDGQGRDAYLARQPAFQTMPRFLVHETGVHFVDLFRWWFGDVAAVYADLRQLNPVIAGEDAGLLILHHTNGVRTVFDGNRLADHAASNPRHTMGELFIDAERGELRLDGEGALWLRMRGETAWSPRPVTRPVDMTRFGGGCVAALIAHVVSALRDGSEIENTLADYLPVMRVCEAAYQSQAEGRRIAL